MHAKLGLIRLTQFKCAYSIHSEYIKVVEVCIPNPQDLMELLTKVREHFDIQLKAYNDDYTAKLAIMQDTLSGALAQVHICI